jgi:hypothetical protein
MAWYSLRRMRVPGRPLTRTEKRTLVVLGIGALLALAGTVLGRVAFGVQIAEFTADPATTRDFPDYVGYVSHLSVLAWTAGATVALLGAHIATGPPRRFLLGAGILTAVLTLDDLFRVHEDVGSAIGDSGELAILALYAAAAAALLRRSRTFLLASTPVLVLVAAGGLFAFSVALDHSPVSVPAEYLFEDGSKLLGILAWASFLSMVTLDTVRLQDTPC